LDGVLFILNISTPVTAVAMLVYKAYQVYNEALLESETPVDHDAEALLLGSGLSTPCNNRARSRAGSFGSEADHMDAQARNAEKHLRYDEVLSSTLPVDRQTVLDHLMRTSLKSECTSDRVVRKKHGGDDIEMRHGNAGNHDSHGNEGMFSDYNASGGIGGYCGDKPHCLQDQMGVHTGGNVRLFFLFFVSCPQG
jgi:hypothetical protein